MKTKLLFPVLLSLLSISCSKEPLPIVEFPCVIGCDSITLDPIWAIPLHKDSFQSKSPIILTDGNNLLYSRLFSGPHDILTYVNGETGEKIWTWDDPSYLVKGEEAGTHHSVFLLGDYFVLTGLNRFYCLDKNTGEQLWYYETPDHSDLPAYFSVFGDKAYISIDYHFNRSDQVSTLVSIDPRNGPVLDTITSVTVENGYKPSIPCVEVYKDEVGDTIIIFQNRQYHFQEVDAKVDLYKYNKTKGVVEWKVEDLVEDGNSNVRAPLIYDGQIFFQGGKAVYSVDLKTGEKIWEQKFGVPHSFHLGSNLVVVDGILIVNPEDVGVYGVDPKTGEYLWVNSEIGGGPTDMVVNDKYVYFTSNDNQWMYAIDGTTGEVVWKQKSDWSVNSFFQFSAVAVNPDLRHVYASDGYFLFCMEMPE